MTQPIVAPETEAASIARLADRAAAREVITLVDDKSVGVVLAAGQQLQTIDLEEYAERPWRKKGAVSVRDADSFISYVERHKVPAETTLWSDVDKGRVIAVIDDHGDQAEETPGWGEHRATLALTETPDWKHWLKADGVLMTQGQFAEHIEDGTTAIRNPSAADMLEIAQTFHATTGMQFKSSQRLQSGETQLRYEESIDAKAGRTGAVEIPDTITLGLQPFEGSSGYEVVARFRYRIFNGELKLAYRLIRPDLARQAAFTDITAQIASATGLTVLAGTPRQ